jgi:hypothetical protein
MNVNDLFEGIEELSISGSSKIRISLNGEKIFQIIALTTIDDDLGKQIVDIHLQEVVNVIN